MIKYWPKTLQLTFNHIDFSSFKVGQETPTTIGYTVTNDPKSKLFTIPSVPFDIFFCLYLGGVQQTFWVSGNLELSRVVRKPAFCICENKDADQLRGNREADQRLCFRHIDSTIPLLTKYEISSL